MKKVLITDSVHSVLREGLEEADYICDYEPDISSAEVTARIGEYTGLIINSKIKADRHFIDKANRLEFIARLGSGREVVDIPYAESRGISVYFSPEGNSNAVGEHTLGMLLAFANNLIRGDREVRQQIWNREQNRGFELKGKTIGIIGFGHTGPAFASKLKGLDMNILVYDKYRKGLKKEYGHVHETGLSEIQHEAQIISFHLPLSTETRHFCNAEFIDGCRLKPLIINTSRGSIIDTPALLDGLQQKKLKGACLDVFENENPVTFSQEERQLYEALYMMDNVILSPHVAGWTSESKYLLGKVLLDKILYRT